MLSEKVLINQKHFKIIFFGHLSDGLKTFLVYSYEIIFKKFLRISHILTIKIVFKKGRSNKGT